MIVVIALAVTAVVLAVDYLDARSTESRRGWFRLQLPLVLCAVPATAAVALMTYADGGSSGGRSLWLLVLAPVAAAAAFLLALIRRGRRRPQLNAGASALPTSSRGAPVPSAGTVQRSVPKSPGSA